MMTDIRQDLSGIETGRRVSTLEVRGSSSSLGEVADDLVRARLGASQSVALTVMTDSMRPTILPGDRVIVQAARTEGLHLGDILVLQAGNVRLVHRLVGHRVVGRELILITKGDSSAEADAPWPAGQLLGIAVAVERQALRLDLRSARARSAGAIVALLSRGQGMAQRKLHGVMRAALCRGLAVALRAAGSLT